MAYTRKPEDKRAHVVFGRVTITNSGNAAIDIASLPTITLTDASSKKQLQLPKEGIKCPGPSRTVPAGEELVCKFNARYTKTPPKSGSVSASVALLDGTTLKAAAAPPDTPHTFSFSQSELVLIGESAEVSCFFEDAGKGLVQPQAIHGETPQPGLRLGASSTFKFYALFDASGEAGNCGSKKVRHIRWLLA